MANNYTRFSEILHLANATEAKWWEDEMARVEDTDEPLADGVDIYVVNDEAVQFIAEDCGDIEALGYVVQRFLQVHKNTGVFTLTWADTCSKMRTGEFSGGYMIVTAESVDIQSVGDLLFKASGAYTKGERRKHLNKA